MQTICFCGMETSTRVLRMKVRATFIKHGLNEAKIWWVEFHLTSFEGLWQLWFSQPLRSWHYSIEILRNKNYTISLHFLHCCLWNKLQNTIFYYFSVKEEKITTMLSLDFNLPFSLNSRAVMHDPDLSQPRIFWLFAHSAPSLSFSEAVNKRCGMACPANHRMLKRSK